MHDRSGLFCLKSVCLTEQPNVRELGHSRLFWHARSMSVWGLSRNCGLSGLAGSSTLLVRPDANYPREALRRRLPTITAQRQVRRPAEMKARRESARPGTVPIRREFVAQYWPPVPPRGHCECRMEVFVSLRGFSTAQ
jgi:hypothetical protein